MKRIILISILAVTLSGCGYSLIPSGIPTEIAPAIAERTGVATSPGDEAPIVFNSVTGGYEAAPITGVTPEPEAPVMIEYTGLN